MHYLMVRKKAPLWETIGNSFCYWHQYFVFSNNIFSDRLITQNTHSIFLGQSWLMNKVSRTVRLWESKIKPYHLYQTNFTTLVWVCVLFGSYNSATMSNFFMGMLFSSYGHLVKIPRTTHVDKQMLFLASYVFNEVVHLNFFITFVDISWRTTDCSNK